MDFLRAVDAALDEALPADWPRVAPERLSREKYRLAQVRHAFTLWSAGPDAGEPGGAREPRASGPGAGEPAASDERDGEERDCNRRDGARETAAPRRRSPYLGIIALPRQAVGLPEAQ